MNNSIFRIYLFLLIFSPLAFGTVEQWSLTVMEIAALFSLCLFLVHVSRALFTRTETAYGYAARLYDLPGILPLVLFLSYMLVQLIPIPSFLIKVLSPGAHGVYSNTVWLDGSLQLGSLSLDRKATLLEFFRMLAYAAFYVMTAGLLTKKEYFKRTVGAVVIFVSLLSLFAIIQHFSFNGKIYWIRELTQGGAPFGPYVNRNHYAGLMIMVLPLVLALLIFYKPEMRDGTVRERLLDIFSRTRSNVQMLLILSLTLVAVSIFLSLSRGGIISLSVSMMLFGISIAGQTNERRKGIAVIGIFIIILYAVGWFGWDAIFERFERIRDHAGDISEMRLALWKDSLHIVKDFFLTGAGFGSFLALYPKYRSIPLGGIADHAHNDYIELMTDGGIIAVLLFGWFIISVIRSSFRDVLQRRDRYAIYVFIAAVTGLTAMLIHSVTDFNLHIGANGLYFFFLLGLAVSSARTHHWGGKESSLPDTSKRTRLFLGTYIAGIMLVFSGMIGIGLMLGNYYHSSIDRTRLDAGTPEQELSEIRGMAAKALFHDPLEGRYRFTYADAAWLLKKKDEAVTAYTQAVRLDPLNGEYIQKLGLVMSENGRSDMANALLRFGTVVERMNPLRYQIYGSWQIKKGKKREGINTMRIAISMEPNRTKDYITLLVLHGLDDREILNAMPDMVSPHMQLAQYLERTGNREMALEGYRKVLEIDPGNKRAKRKLERVH